MFAYHPVRQGEGKAAGTPWPTGTQTRLFGRLFLVKVRMLRERERTRPGLGIIEPCLPSPAKAPPSGPGWIHEIKHDGFRILARHDSAGVPPRPS